MELCEPEAFGVWKEVVMGVQAKEGRVIDDCSPSAAAPNSSVQVVEGMDTEGAHVVCGDGERLKGRAEIEAAVARI